MNYIVINNKKINLTDQQIDEIKESLGIPSVKLSSIPVGETFKIGECEFIVLEHRGDTTAVILKDLLFDNEKFGDKNNNYADSIVDRACEEFADGLSGIIGAKNIIEHTIDLTSDDGLKDYGKIRRRAALLTTELYRRYVNILDKYKPSKWWWLATAYSTPSHDDANWAKCVAPSGNIYGGNYDGYGGVRPFCILNSNIFVSK